ncbi:MAG: hypothetical protein CL920_33475 [Deltaproteobacteria bacterium]|nr:hypothetical protein [Deltaproteobacteria bacterium]MBU53636.1 hypothetical protein [Deltaproteobacteria bacterium]|tara:strand:+ start:29633 stop:40360 length:10728 start_codon:yes stop_codon:yes gene_type:complete
MAEEEILNYLRILEAVPSNVPAFEALKQIYTEAERWEELAKLYEDRAERLPDQSQVPALYLQAAVLRYHRLKDIAGAKQAISKVLESQPNHKQALGLWRQIAMAEEDYAMAIKILRQETQLTDDVQEKASRFVEIAKLFETHLDNDDHAAVAYHQAFLLSPTALEAMDNALRLYKKVGEWQRVIAVLRARLESVNDATEKARLLYQIGDIFLRQLDEGRTPEGQEKASQLFKEALELDPEQEDAKEALEELQYELEDWSSLLKRLKKEIRKSSDTPDRAAFLNYKIAEGYYRREGKPAYAIRYCKQALELKGTHTKSLDLIQKLYAELGKWEALADFLTDRSEKADDVESKVMWLKKLTELHKDHTQERDREIETLERIIDIQPNEMETLLRLESIYREDSRFSKALGVMEKRLAIASEDSEKKSLLYNMAEIAHRELERREQAAQYYEDILSIDEDDVDAIDALLPLYEKEGDWEKLIGGHERRLAHTSDKIERAQIHTRIGDIYGNQLSLSKEAFDAYTQALRENPQDNELTEKLESLARQIGNWQEMIELYRSTLDLAEDPGDQAALHFRIGDTYEREIGNVELARRSYEEALEFAPHLETMNALQRIYRQSEEWIELAELLKEKSKAEALEKEERITVLQELARIQESHIDDPDGAAEAYETILEFEEAHQHSLESLERIYKQTENWESLRGVYQRRIDNPTSEGELKSTLHILGSLLIEKLEALDGAVPIYQRLRVLDEHDNLVLTRLEELFRQLERWEEWVETARGRADSIRRPEQRKEVLFEIAVVQEQNLEDAEGASRTLREIHNIDATDTKVLDELERLLIAAEDVAGLLEILRKKVDLSESSVEKKELLFRMAELFRQTREEDEMAAVYREVLRIDESDLKALRALQGYHQLQGDHEAVLELLLRERDAVTDEEKVGLSQRIAQLETALGRYREAISEYQSILQIDPEDELAREALENIAKEQESWNVEALTVLEPIYRNAQDWENLVLALEARFEVVEPRVRVELARELEEIYRLRLSDDEQAFQWSTQLLREDFQDPEVRERVELMADEMERWDVLLVVYEDIVRSFVDPEQINETYLFIARNYQDRLELPEEALRNYRKVLDYSPNNEEAIDALEDLYRQMEQWRDLVDILRMRVGISEETDEKKQLLFDVADLWEEKLEDPPEAIQVFCDILELDENDLSAIRRLASLYERERHYPELAELWERELQLLEDEEEILALRYQLGEVYGDYLGKIERALELFQQVLDQNPDHTEAIQRTEALIEEDDYRLLCARILEPIYLHQENYAELRTMYKIQLEDSTQSASERRKALMRLGLLHEEKLGEYREAFDRYLQVFKEEPGHEGTREALLRNAETLGVWSEVVGAFEAGVSKIEDVEERVQTHLVLAKLHTEQLQNPDKGVTHYRTVVDDLDPKNLEAIEALEEYYKERELWNELIEILFQKEQALTDGLEKKEVFNQVASIYETQLENNSQAIFILRQYLMRLEDQEELPVPGKAEVDEAEARVAQLQQEVEEYADAIDLAKDTLSTLTSQVDDVKEKIADIDAQLEDLEEDEDASELQAERERQVGLLEGAEAAQQAKATEVEELTDKLDASEEAEADATDVLRDAQSNMESLADEAEQIKEQHVQFQLDTIRDLARLFEAEERWSDLVEIVDKEIALIDDEAVGLELRFRVATLWEEKLQQTPRAIELYRAILDDDPDFEQALEALERISEEDDYELMVAESLESYFRDGREDWTRLIEMIEIRLNHTEDNLKRLEFLKEIVQLYELELDNIDMAFVYLCRAFREAPTDRDVISELERLAEESDAWEELVGVYEDEVEDIDDIQLALRMYLKIANIYDEALQDTDEAILNFTNALKLDEHNSAALGALDRLYRQQKNWEELVEILRRKVYITENEREQITLWSRIATIYEKELDELGQSINAYRQILEVDAENNNALSALEKLYHQVERWDELYDICQRKTSLVESASERAKLRKKMAQLCAGPLGKPEEAIELYENVLDSNERDEESLTALETLYQQTERWDSLVDVVTRLLSVVTGVERKKGFYRVLGQTYGEHLNDEQKAIEGWQKVLDLDPKDLEALEALRVIYERHEEWQSLVGILRRLIPLQAEQSDMLELYYRLAHIYQDKMSKLEDAISAWRRVLEIDPTHWEALETLETLLRERKDWRAVLGIIEKKEVVVVEPQDKIELLLTAANISHEQLFEPNRATPYFERILDIDPTHMETVSALRDIYTKNQDWKKLLRINNIEVQLVSSPEEKVEKLSLIASTYENKLFNKAEAFHTYIRAFEIVPASESVREELERIAAETDRWEDLVDVFSGQVNPEVPEPNVIREPVLDENGEQVYDENGEPFYTERVEEVEIEQPVVELDDATRIALFMRIGYIYNVELRDPEPSIESYQKVLELDENQMDAIQALEELYEDTERWGDLIEIFGKKLLLTDDIEEQKDLLLRIAELWEHQLDDRISAIQAYKQIQDIDPDDLIVLEALENLYRLEERWEELIDILQRRIQQSTHTNAIFEMQFEIGQVYDQELDMPEQAVDAYGHVLSLDPTNMGALRALEKLYTNLERWDAFLQTLATEIELVKRPDEKIPLFFRRAIVFEEELMDNEAAIHDLQQILEIDRWSLPAIKGLERLYHQQQEWDKLIEVFEQHIRAVDDLEQMAELYYNIGAIYQIHLGQTDRSITYYQRVLDADPFYQPALSALGKLYEAAGNWPKCIEMMEREARVLNEPETLVEVYHRIGKIYEERLVQIDRAKDSYRKALEIQPGYLPSLRSLKVIHFLQRDWNGVIHLATQQEQFTEDVDEKATIFCEIGKLYKDRLNDNAQAATYYQQALNVSPGNVAAARPLADLYIDQGQFAEAEGILEMLLDVMNQRGITEEKYRYHYMLALAAENMENTQKALYQYQESYNLNPTYFPTLNGLGRIYYTEQEWERSLKVYQTILYHHRAQLSERELSEVYYRMALAYDQMGQADQAIDFYERALEIDPANPLALRSLAAHAESRQEWARALELKERLLLVLDDENERLQLTLELGQMCQHQLGQHHQAIDFYRQAFMIQPENVEILYRMLELFELTQQWVDMIDTLEQLLQLEGDTERQIQYNFRIAELYQNMLQNAEMAVAYYNRVLDINFLHEAAFQAIETMLFNMQQWQLLDENYRLMIKRLPQDESQQQMKLDLWRKLGDLYRYKLENIDNAVMAYELVYKMEPSVKNLEVLAELYGQKDEFRPKAVEIHHELLRRNAARIESYKSLIRLYYELQNYDRSFATCSTLRFLRETSPEEEQFYKSMKAKAPDRIKRAFREDEVWKQILFHDNVRTPLADILAILYQFCGAEFAKSTKEFKIKKTDRVDPNLFFSRTYEYVAQVLGLTPVEVYQTAMLPGLRVVNTYPPVMLAGADMFKERHPKELLFMIARQLTFSRPEFLFASVLSYQEYRALLSSFFNMYSPNYPLECSAEVADRIKKRIGKSLPAERRDQLNNLVQMYLQEQNPIQPDQFLEGIEHTSNRVGFCLAGDLNIASKVCEREVREDFKVAHRGKVKELVLFSISENYFNFREKQGLTVKL